MKPSKTVIELIKASFKESKVLLIERAISAVLIILCTAVFYIFFKSNNVILLGTIIFLSADKYISRGRSKFCDFSYKNKFLNSILPLSRTDKLYLNLYNNIQDNTLHMLAAISFLVLVIENISNPYKIISFIILGTLQALFLASYPFEFHVIDKNLMPKESSLKYLVLFVLAFLNTIGGIIFLGLNMNLWVPVLKSLPTHVVEDRLLYIILFIVNIIAIKWSFGQHWHVRDEHKQYQKHNRSRPFLLKKYIKIFASIYVVNIFVLIFFLLNVSNSRYYFFILEELNLTNFTLFEAIKKNDVASINKLDIFNEKHQDKYQWYKPEFAMVRILKQGNSDTIKLILGNDILKWDQKYCELFNKNKKCPHNALLTAAIKNNALKTIRTLLHEKSYTVDDSVAQVLLVQTAQACDGDTVNLLISRGHSPNSLNQKGELQNVYKIMLDDTSKKCKKALSNIFTNKVNT